MKLNLNLGQVILLSLAIFVVLIFGTIFLVPDLRAGVIGTFKSSFSDPIKMVQNQSPQVTPDPQVAPDPQGAATPVVSEPLKTFPTPVVKDAPFSLEVHVLNGQGTAVLLRDGGQTALIDAGSLADAPNLVAKLKALGVTRLDYAVGSNYHQVSVAGFPKILSSFNSEYILSSQNVANAPLGSNLRSFLSSRNLVWTVPGKVAKFQLGDASFSLYPTHEGGSLVTVVSLGQSNIVLTGDITYINKSLIEQLPENVDLLSISTRNTSYKVPPTLLERLKPKGVVIGGKVGTKAYNEAVNKVQASSEMVYTLSTTGDLQVSSNGQTVKVEGSK